MVVGLPFSGKTSCYRVLAEAQTLLNQTRPKEEYALQGSSSAAARAPPVQ